MSSSFILTLWRTFSKGRRANYSWSEFVDTFVAQPEVVRIKERVAGFSLASFEGNRRALSRVEQVHALTLDFDQGDTTIEQAQYLLPETRGVTYTTFSHTPKHPKLRVIYPFSRPVDASEYERIWMWIASKIGTKHALDEATRDASRFWYLPSHKPGAEYEWQTMKGSALDVPTVLKESWDTLPSFPGKTTSPERRPRPSFSRKARSVCDDSADESFFGRAFVAADMAFELLDNGALAVTCPWAREHTSGFDGDSSTVVFPPTSEARWGLFHCSHAHCVHRTGYDLLDVLPTAALEAARREHGSGFVRARIRAGWVQTLSALPGFPALDRLVLHCYPYGGGPPLVWTVKIGSKAHVEGLGSLSAEALRKQDVDLAVRGREIVWGRLAKSTAQCLTAG